jgi:Mg2+/Co2+ transporter CorC
VKLGTIEAAERRMIDSIFRFSDKKVGDVMLHRTDMTSIDLASPIESVVDLAVQTGYSRIPVFKGNRDNIVGVLHTRDLLSVWKHRELIVLHDVVRPPFFVPKSMPVDHLLREFQKGRFHMAIVVDEYGGTAGVVTLEDLVEEIIGDIRDEHEAEEEKPIVRNEDGSFTVEAGTPLEKVNEIIGMRLVPKGEVAKSGGLCGGTGRQGPQEGADPLRRPSRVLRPRGGRPKGGQDPGGEAGSLADPKERGAQKDPEEKDRGDPDRGAVRRFGPAGGVVTRMDLLDCHNHTSEWSDGHQTLAGILEKSRATGVRVGVSDHAGCGGPPP